MTGDVNMVQADTRGTLEVSVLDLRVTVGADINQMIIMNERVQGISTPVWPQT